MPVVDARRALLSRLFDHAPLFPPASMGLEDAVAEDARAAASKSSSLLGRFVVPALRLGELDGFDRALSVVLDGPLAEDARIEAVEARLPEQPQALAELAPEVYLEIPLDEARARRERFHSVGSCSFFEPVCELEALGVLPL